MVANNALNPIDFGKRHGDMGLSQRCSAFICSRMVPHQKNHGSAAQNSQDRYRTEFAAKGLMIVWAECFGVLVSALAADGEMTPQRAAEMRMAHAVWGAAAASK